MNCFVPDVFEEVAGLVNHAKLSAVEGERSGVGVASLDDLEHHWIGLSFDCELTASGAVLDLSEGQAGSWEFLNIEEVVAL